MGGCLDEDAGDDDVGRDGDWVVAMIMVDLVMVVVVMMFMNSDDCNNGGDDGECGGGLN